MAASRAVPSVDKRAVAKASMSVELTDEKRADPMAALKAEG